MSSADHAAAEDDVAVIKHDGLAGGDGSHRGVKHDADPIVRQQGHGGRTARVAVADLGGDFQGRVREIVGGPDYLPGCQFPGKQAVCAADYHFMVFHVQGFDEEGLAVGDAEAFSLADGVEGHALMAAQRLSVFVNDLTRLQTGWVMGLDEGVIIVVGDKADLLAFRLLGYGQGKFGRQLSHLGLGVVPQGKVDMVKDFLGKLVEHIGLVFLPVNGPDQSAAAPFVRNNAGVVAGGDMVAAKVGGNLSQCAEFYVAIAKNAGVGGQSGSVLLEEGLDDFGGKLFSQVGHMMAEAENITDPAGVAEG